VDDLIYDLENALNSLGKQEVRK